ncbi:hypothetical protein [Microbacterium xylanilyticum]
MSNGPVSEGSIVAYIGADDDDYQEKMRRAQATAEELGRSDPTVNVHADVATALAKIDEVASKTNELTRAETRLDAAARAAANAASSQYLAELRLAEIQEKGTASAYQLAAANEAVARASRNAEAAEQRQIAAEIALRNVQAVPPGETPTADAKTDGKAPASSGGGVGYYGGWAIGIASTLPMLADLVGAAAAGTGAFLGLGAAGVAAIAGIKGEMASGSDEGRIYSAVVARLHEDLDALEQTAASGILTGVEASMRAIDSQMPQLNAEISGFASGLGTIAGTTVDGIVTGFHILNPLFNEAEAGIQGMAFQWDRWIHNGGLQQWGDDVQRVFPLVTDTLGTLGDAVLKIVGDLQPLGTAMLATADGAAHVLQWLASLGPMFPPIALGAVAAVAAFHNFDTIAPILDKVTQGVFDFTGAQAAAEARTIAVNAALAAGASAEDAYAAGMKAVEAASGPAGWVMLAASAAVGVLAAGLTAGADAAGAASTALQDYSGAVQQDKGVVGDATQAVLAKNLVTSDAIGKAKELGISEAAVTAAIVQGGSARDDLIASLQKTSDATVHLTGARGQHANVMTVQGHSAKALTDTINDQSHAIEKAVSEYQAQVGAIGILAGQAQTQITQQGLVQAAFGLTADQIASATREQQQLAQQTAWASTQLNIENAAAQAFNQTMQLMNNGALNVSMAQTALASATMNATKSFQQNGATLDTNTQSGIANRQSLEQALQAIENVSNAVVTQTASQEQGNKALEDGKQALKNQLAALGDLTPEVAAYIDQVKSIPTRVETDVQLNIQHALTSIRDVRSAMSDLNGSVSGSGRMGTYSTGGPVYRAGGGGIPAYLAGGGTGLFQPQGTDTVPAMLTPGEMVIRRKSADYDPQFIRTYNDDPERALAEVRAGAGAKVEQHFHVTGVQQTDPNVLGAVLGTRMRRGLAGMPGFGGIF